MIIRNELENFWYKEHEKEGYQFIGWETEDDDLFDISGIYQLTNDIFLTAKWEPIGN